ncbi:hypothetical protein [Brachybacterium sp. GPGPB12]|uniref:hypothetical protein n=1 Tax=Brachybacterium sp. GPGPB12 TaxID=3023517 RepID=UPI0031345859
MAGKIRKRDTGEAGNKGEFGNVSRRDAEVLVSGTSDPAVQADEISAGVIGRLPYEISPLDESIVRENPEMEGRAFEEGFVEHFGDASTALDEHGGDLDAVLTHLGAEQDQRLARLPRIFGVDRVLPAPDSDDDRTADGEEWAVSYAGPGGVVISWMDHDGELDGPSLRRTTAAAKDAGVRLARTHALRRDVNLLSEIRSGAKAPWAFLSPTGRQQQRHENVVPRLDSEIQRLVREQEEFEQARRRAATDAGLSDKQIEQKVRGPMVKDGGIHRFQWGRKVEENLWHDPSEKDGPAGRGGYIAAYTDDELNEEVKRRIEGTRRAEEDAERLTDPGRSARLEDLRQRREYYERCPGWPGGDLPPQWSTARQEWVQMNAVVEGGRLRTEMSPVLSRPGGATDFPGGDRYPVPDLGA